MNQDRKRTKINWLSNSELLTSKNQLATNNSQLICNSNQPSTANNSQLTITNTTTIAIRNTITNHIHSQLLITLLITNHQSPLNYPILIAQSTAKFQAPPTKCQAQSKLTGSSGAQVAGRRIGGAGLPRQRSGERRSWHG